MALAKHWSRSLCHTFIKNITATISLWFIKVYSKGERFLSAIDSVTNTIPNSNEATSKARRNGETLQHRFGTASYFLTIIMKLKEVAKWGSCNSLIFLASFKRKKVAKGVASLRKVAKLDSLNSLIREKK